MVSAITTDVPGTVPGNTATPWALPTWTSGPGRPRRLFFTPTNLTRFNNNWTNVAYCAPVVSQCINFQSVSSNIPIVNALYYLHTGTSSYATTAYNLAVAIPYQSAGYGLFGFGAHPAAFVLDWCYDALTSTQVANLIALLDNMLTSNFETQFNQNPSFHEHYKANNDSWLICAIAIQGEVGATDRNVKIRNASQNWFNMFNEVFADGVHTAYPYQEGFWFYYWILYEIATGQTINATFMQRRIEMICRQFRTDAIAIDSFEGDQSTQFSQASSAGPSASGTGIWMSGPEWLCYTMGKYYAGRSGYFNQVWQWLGDACNPYQGTGQSILVNGWGNQIDAPGWLGMMFYDNSIPRTSPDNAGFPLNRSGSIYRTASFRSGWSTFNSSNVDVNVWFMCRPEMAHSARNSSGEVNVFRGVDDLLPRGATYIGEGGAGKGFTYYDDFDAYAWSANTIEFCPAGSITPDSDGSQAPLFIQQLPVAGTRAANGSTYFPYAGLYDRTLHFRNGEFTNVDLPSGGSGSYGMVWADITECFEFSRSPVSSNPTSGSPAVTSATRKIVCIPGASPGQMTILIRDQFAFTSNAIGTIKWGWFCRQQPSVVSKFSPVLQAGTSLAGLTTYNAGATLTSVAAPTITGITAFNSSTVIASGGSVLSNSLVLSGTAFGGATISVYDGVTLLGTAVANYVGAWTYSTGAVLAAATTHSFTATATYWGVTSSASAAYSAVVISPPFLSSSLWNQTVTQTKGGSPTYTTIAWPASTGFNYNVTWDHASPGLYFAKTSDPLVSVTGNSGWNWPNNPTLRIPAGVTGGGPADPAPVGNPPTNADYPLLVVDPDGRTVWNFYQFRRNSNTTATCSAYAKADAISGTGFGVNATQTGAGINSAGASELGGLLVQTETDAGPILHALLLALDNSLLLGPHGTYVAPAIDGDGNTLGAPVIEGSLLAIPPATSMPGGLSTLGQQVFTCLKTYGCYVVDNGSDQTALRAPPNYYNSTVIASLKTDLQTIIPLLKIVT